MSYCIGNLVEHVPHSLDLSLVGKGLFLEYAIGLPKGQVPLEYWGSGRWVMTVFLYSFVFITHISCGAAITSFWSYLVVPEIEKNNFYSTNKTLWVFVNRLANKFVRFKYKKTMIYIRLARFNSYILTVVNDDVLPSFHQLHKAEIAKPLWLIGKNPLKVCFY